MKRWSAVAVVLAVAVTGCSKEADCEAFMSENTAFAAAVVSANEKDGVDGARKTFDALKGELRKRWDLIKDARGFQVKEETRKRVKENRDAAHESVCALHDPKVCDEYAALFDEGP
ncbi:MAG: hypothetical protein U0414_10200 [Polyangiaceae bacterium]